MRRLLSFGILAMVVAGCGAAADGPGPAGLIYADAPAPPVVAVDETPPPAVARLLQLELGQHPADSGFDTVGSSGTGQTCVLTFSWGGTPSAPAASAPAPAEQPSCSQATPAQQAQMLAQQQQWQRAIAPAPGHDPRTIATLPLADGGTAWLTVWTTAAGALCWQVDAEHPGGGGGGPHGPCQDATAPGAPPCDTLCLSSSGSGDAQGPTTYILAGTVPADAEALRVTLDGGAAATYPLTGPALPGLVDRRVFMLELGTHDWRTLELIRDAAVARTVRMPAAQAAFEHCSGLLGPPKPAVTPPLTGGSIAQAMQPYEDEMNACLTAATPPGTAVNP